MAAYQGEGERIQPGHQGEWKNCLERNIQFETWRECRNEPSAKIRWGRIVCGRNRERWGPRMKKWKLCESLKNLCFHLEDNARHWNKDGSLIHIKKCHSG